MPSDPALERAPDRADLALAAVRSRLDAFHAAVAHAEEEVRSDLLHRQGRSSFKEEQALMELGPFALGRIDPARFANLIGNADPELSPQDIDVMRQADETLRRFSDASQVHRVRVEPGGDLRDAVKDALSDVGRLFGAARAVELARAGTFDIDRDVALFGPQPFRSWNRAERRLAPPLVVEVRGEDCRAAGLGEFLDGAVAIVLVVEGPSTPAPLARLVTPGTFVLQTADPDDLRRVAETDHPAVAVLFDEPRPEQALFVHDPDAGDAPWSRLEIGQLPDEPAVGRGHRAPAWLEEVDHLRALASPPRAETAAPEAPAPASPSPAAVAATPAGNEAAEPVDRLAAWLLAQADLNGA